MLIRSSLKNYLSQQRISKSSIIIMLRRILRYAFSSSSSEPLKKMYVLSQFPYPSGDLHLGHARVYYIGDSLSEYYRLKNYKVIYPIGWDSFGLPAQNAAIVHGKNPKQWTVANIQRMKQQLNHLNINFNWQMQLSTCQPQYYRWTQEIFVKMFKKGLAYKKMAEVNWDPVDKTVLANEQVDENGCSWRSGAKVQKKQLSQWFLKITDFAEQLQSSLDDLEWVEKVKNMQKGWIGFKKGFNIKLNFKPASNIKSTQSQIQVFVENIQALEKAKFIVKKLKDYEAMQQKDTLQGKVLNPLTNQQILVIHSPKQYSQSYSLIQQKDLKFNQHYRDIYNKFKNQLVQSKQSKAESQNLKLSNAQDLLNSAKNVKQMKIKDWLISRQRFWGCPIPIVYCQDCGVVPVPQEQLPVILPEWKNDGNPLLKDEFKKCQCPKCGSHNAERQSDTMDTFVDSSWYFLRFMDAKNSKEIFSKPNLTQMMPVDIYIGGIQHAIMHLLYARFVMRFIKQEYVLPNNCLEPFKQLVVQGLVKGKTLSLRENGKYISQKQVDEGKYNMDNVKITYEKMSKSKFNGLNPNILVDKFGSDALRLSLFFANPPDRDIDFSQQIVSNAQKFLKRIQNLWKQLSLLKPSDFSQANPSKQLLPKQELLKLKTIFQKMQISIEKRLMHTYVANVMQMFNLIKQHVQIQSSFISKTNKVKLFAVFLRVLKIVAPQLSKTLKGNLLTKFGSFLNAEDFDKWPSDELFGEKIQVLIMKGKKMISKDTVDIGLNDDQIVKILNLEGKVNEIKRQKKKYVVILKD